MRRPPDLSHSRQITQGTLSLQRQTLYDERRQIVLKHHVFKIMM